ncbi:hypothetical protein [Halomarina pelagica]|uniref:hypothetical protein n=1 Tax=Halomarina pelagica TaxID=2961599 RepID=UPI0020C2FFDE|nr:hypothetical protein [Halomarina sp. BND7]
MQEQQTELPPQDLPEDEYQFRLPAESQLERWLLFDANRWTVAGLILVGVLLSFLSLGWIGVLDFTNASTVTLLLSVVIAGNFTLISIVITINQLVLSREFGKPHSLRERNEGIEAFRRRVEETIGIEVGSVDPIEFLRGVIGAISDRAAEVRSGASEAGTERTRRDVERYATSIVELTAVLDEALSRAEFGDFDVLVQMLFYRSARQIHGARRLRLRYADALPRESIETLETLERLLRHFNIARQYIQTLYMQQELATLSRLLLYVGIPSLVVTALGMLVYTSGGGLTIGERNAVVVFSLVMTVGFVPISLLLSYVIRVSTVVSRMPLLNPFITDG